MNWESWGPPQQHRWLNCDTEQFKEMWILRFWNVCFRTSELAKSVRNTISMLVMIFGTVIGSHWPYQIHQSMAVSSKFHQILSLQILDTRLCNISYVHGSCNIRLLLWSSIEYRFTFAKHAFRSAQPFPNTCSNDTLSHPTEPNSHGLLRDIKSQQSSGW